jgi:hypothetical protein
VSRFEHADKICRRWQRRYKRKGFGRVPRKQGGDPRIVPSRKRDATNERSPPT